MRRNIPISMIGNSLALMVAATTLAKNGVDVTIINSSKNWGGHFTTVACGGTVFDPGMVLHEFTSFSPQCGAEAILTYNAEIRNDVGRFCDVVNNYISKYQISQAIATPSMIVEGRMVDDVLIANALLSLRLLPFASEVASELRSLVEPSIKLPLHASHKHLIDDFKRLTYEEVSLANHGATLHRRLIEPFCRKLLGVSTRDVLALYHRVAWLPLFYPETLLSYLNGSPQELPPTVFSYPRGGSVGGLANKLKAEIENNEHIAVVSDRPTRISATAHGTFEIAFENQATMFADVIAWGNALGDLLRTLGVDGGNADYQKCSIALAFMRIPVDALKRDFTVLSVVDPELVTYRITNQSRCAAIDHDFASIVVECNPDYLSMITGGTSDLSVQLKIELELLGVVTDSHLVDCIEVRQMTKGLMLPSKENRDAYLQESHAVQHAAPSILLVGPASGFFSSSFNDQIVQGLKLAKSWDQM